MESQTVDAIHPDASSRHDDDKADIVYLESTKKQSDMDVFRSYSPEMIRETERKLIRKIDSRLLTFMVTIYLFNYLDRNSITQARLYGLENDTHISGATYNTAIAIFSAGYICMQLPSTLLMNKLPPHIFLPAVICTWAIISGLTAATSSAASLLTVRFILGIVEAPFFPGAIYYLSCWYTKRELGLRMALLVSALLLSNSFAGLISAGVLSGMANVGHLAAWRWLFILEGLATFTLGFVAFFVIPDYPGTTKWLTETEKIVAQGRLAADAGIDEIGDDDETTITKGIMWALRDYRVWLYACLQMATTAAISFSHFLPTLVQDLGFSNSTEVLLLTSPPYLFAFFWAVAFGFDADRRQKRSPHAMICSALALAATICLTALGSQQWARYALTFPICAGTFGIYSITYPWLSSTIVKPRIKRASAIGIANTLANCASLFANYFWLDKYAPYYRESWACLIAFQALGGLCIIALRYSMKRSNAHFEKLAVDMDLHSPAGMAAISRLTEEEQRAVLNGYRYIE